MRIKRVHVMASTVKTSLAFIVITLLIVRYIRCQHCQQVLFNQNQTENSTSLTACSVSIGQFNPRFYFQDN